MKNGDPAPSAQASSRGAGGCPATLRRGEIRNMREAIDAAVRRRGLMKTPGKL